MLISVCANIFLNVYYRDGRGRKGKDKGVMDEGSREINSCGCL